MDIKRSRGIEREIQMCNQIKKKNVFQMSKFN